MFVVLKWKWRKLSGLLAEAVTAQLIASVSPNSGAGAKARAGAGAGA